MFDLRWKKCLNYFKKKLSKYEFSMWIRSLKPKFKKNKLILYAPNQFILDWVKENYFKKINYLINNFDNYRKIYIKLIINTQLKTTQKYINSYFNKNFLKKKKIIINTKKKNLKILFYVKKIKLHINLLIKQQKILENIIILCLYMEKQD
ncbi:DnaA N-terminal domain-containing protein [Buchnera aphidicola]|uniref:DnaA N-terminal domain-containing protein n=1 Tax=Buchnera aphidicola TaxID=9 RepID=UPI0034647DBB